MGPEELQRFIEANEIEAETVRLRQETPTVQAAAEVVGTHPDQIAKSLLFLVAERPVLVIACGTDPVRRGAIGDHYRLEKQMVKLASPAQVMELTGYEVGAVPPFGHREPIDTLMDESVMDQEVIYAGGGGARELVRVAPAEIARVTGAQVASLTDAGSSEPRS